MEELQLYSWKNQVLLYYLRTVCGRFILRVPSFLVNYLRCGGTSFVSGGQGTVSQPVYVTAGEMLVAKVH